MGGNALKHLNVQRIPAKQYAVLACKVQQRFSTLFGQIPDLVPSYAQKQDFGDCDMLVTSADLPELWREGLAAASNSRGWLRNGDVTSMEIENVQFDFINVPRATRKFAYTYFAYNDLGNLMGRIAHKMRFKYGHEGLVYVLREGDQVLANLPVSAEPSDVFDFMGYDYDRWTEGFETLNDIFEYAASTPFFHPDIYLLHNRNHISRIRDAKRKTYTEFLTWCSAKGASHWTAAWDWTSVVEQQRILHLLRACDRWPKLREDLNTVMAEHQSNKELKTRWNGDLVTRWTGLTGRDLGKFMAHLRNHPDFAVKSQYSEELEQFARAQSATDWQAAKTG